MLSAVDLARLRFQSAVSQPRGLARSQAEPRVYFWGAGWDLKGAEPPLQAWAAVGCSGPSVKQHQEWLELQDEKCL